MKISVNNQNENINASEQNNLIIGDAALGRVLGVSVVTINRLKKANRMFWNQ